MKTLLRACAAVLVLAPAAACTHTQTEKEQPTDMKTASEAAAATGGRGGEMDEKILTVQGAYNVNLAPDKHVETLARIREKWRAQGWTITEDTTSANGKEGALAAKTNSDGYSISLTSTSPPTAFALLVNSPCYRSTDPL